MSYYATVTPKRKKTSLPGKLDIRAVAERARVSIATVSRTINAIPTVGPELAKRVWKAIEELDYYPNTQARSLVSGKSRLLGLVISEITNPFFPEQAGGMAIDGEAPILGLQPSGIHQRTPLVVGGRFEVESFLESAHESQIQPSIVTQGNAAIRSGGI